jgi:hypothetical protein
MDTTKLFYGLLACLVLFVAACTENTADDAIYEQGIDKNKIILDNKNSIDKNKIILENQRESIDKNKIIID